MKFPTEDLKEMLWGDHDRSVYEVMRDEMVDTGRWSIYYRLVFKYQDKYYAVGYGRGATECQDEQPFENEGDTVECDEVQRVEKVVIDYV